MQLYPTEFLWIIVIKRMKDNELIEQKSPQREVTPCTLMCTGQL